MEHETIHTQTMKADFPFFGIISGIYAVFYTFCMYKNASGITLPFFTAGSLLFCFLCMRRLGISVKRNTCFYAAGLMLLSISSFCTADGSLLFFNRVGMFLLLVCLLIHQFCEDKAWGFGKYFLVIFQTVFGTVGSIFRPFTDGIAWSQNRPGRHGEEGQADRVKASGAQAGSGKGIYVFLGLVIACPLVLIIGILLLTSDYVILNMFSRMIQNLSEFLFHFENMKNFISVMFDICLVIVMTVSMFLAAYGIIAYLGKKKIKDEVKIRKNGEPVVMIIVTGLLSVIYLFYSLIQILYLFTGKMSLPDGYTYAEYAREGFFQLLVVCIINLILVLISIRYFKKNRILQTILVIVSVCTYIMLASSALRMIMYIRFYYLTYLRILVLWTLAVLFLLLTGLVITIFKEKFPLFRYGMFAVTVCYLVLSFGHPDYWIAKINTENIHPAENSFFLGEPYDDYYYLGTLSLDAASVIEPLFQTSDVPIEAKIPWVHRFDENLERSGFRTFNLSRYLAARQ